MTTPPRKPLPSRLNPEWANLPRRRCDNCGASYKQVRPLRPGIDRYGFCKPDCKKSFHKNGGAYRKLKGEIVKMVDHMKTNLEKRLREIVREEIEAEQQSRIKSALFNPSAPLQTIAGNPLPRATTATTRKGIQD